MKKKQKNKKFIDKKVFDDIKEFMKDRNLSYYNYSVDNIFNVKIENLEKRKEAMPAIIITLISGVWFGLKIFNNWEFFTYIENSNYLLNYVGASILVVFLLQFLYNNLFLNILYKERKLENNITNKDVHYYETGMENEIK